MSVVGALGNRADLGAHLSRIERASVFSMLFAESALELSGAICGAIAKFVFSYKASYLVAYVLWRNRKSDPGCRPFKCGCSAEPCPHMCL